MISTGWSTLTRMPNKARLYEHDTHFRESLSQAQAAFGPRIAEVLWRSALMIVTPDGLATAQLGVICEYLAGHGFSVVALEPLQFDRLLWRELWRYQLARATLDHLAVNDLILRAGPALILLVRSEDGHDLPATVRLTSLKGKADPAHQVPGTLRSILHQSTYLCSMVHCADEPADLIRELGVLVDSPTRRGLLDRLEAGLLDTAHGRLLDQQLARHSAGGIALDSATALRRITNVVREAGIKGAAPAAVDAVMGYLGQMQRGHTIPWRSFTRELDGLDVKIDHWDLAIVGTAFIVNYEPGVAKMIEGPDPETWKQTSSTTSTA